MSSSSMQFQQPLYPDGGHYENPSPDNQYNYQNQNPIAGPSYPTYHKEPTVPLPQGQPFYYPTQTPEYHIQNQNQRVQSYPLHHHPSLPTLPSQVQHTNSNGHPLGYLPPGYPAPAILTKVGEIGKLGVGVGGGGGLGPPEGFGWEDGRYPGGDDEDDEEDKVGDGEVRHRRRTTPEQLKTLEYWFAINPKPDNNTREWLAAKMGMTKRNVQVWFQNRRAKVKNIAAKERAAAERANADGLTITTATTPEAQIHTSLTSPLSRNGSGHSPDGYIQTPFQPPQPPIYQPTRPLPRSAISDSAQPYLANQMNPPLPTPLSISSQLLSPVSSVNMGRRVSLANGEVANMESYLAKHRRGSAQQRIINGAFVSPVRSPVMAANVRRMSGPYPTTQDSGLSSPKVRAMPSTLHLAAMRNNTRRSSMPGVPGITPGMGLIPGAQLLASGPFTPPRLVSGNYPLLSVSNGNNRRTRELSPIKDHEPDHEDFPGLSLDIPMTAPPTSDGFVFGNMNMNMGMGLGNDFGTSYLTPPNSSYMPTTSPTSYLPDTGSTDSGEFNLGSSGGSMPFTPNGPGVMPGFSFGTNMNTNMGGTVGGMEVEEMWSRGRLGSLASVNSIGTITTDGTGTVSGGEASDWGGEWLLPNGLGGEVDGFDPDTRRASAPADLLHDLNLGILGINTNVNSNTVQPLRPSPLGTHFTSDQEIPTTNTPGQMQNDYFVDSNGQHQAQDQGQSQNQNQNQYQTPAFTVDDHSSWSSGGLDMGYSSLGMGSHEGSRTSRTSRTSGTSSESVSPEGREGKEVFSWENVIHEEESTDV